VICRAGGRVRPVEIVRAIPSDLRQVYEEFRGI
jgi:hypothetical protein